ncbi:MAG: hypothetical protein LBV72_00400 [Tannerella sp.]|nr:hypothetical protein [Tannerella sp.]
MKKAALFGFFIASLMLSACSLGIYGYNIVHAGTCKDTPIIACIAVGWCGMCVALVYTAYKDYKRGY